MNYSKLEALTRCFVLIKTNSELNRMWKPHTEFGKCKLGFFAQHTFSRKLRNHKMRSNLQTQRAHKLSHESKCVFHTKSRDSERMRERLRLKIRDAESFFSSQCQGIRHVTFIIRWIKNLYDWIRIRPPAKLIMRETSDFLSFALLPNRTFTMKMIHMFERNHNYKIREQAVVVNVLACMQVTHGSWAQLQWWLWNVGKLYLVFKNFTFCPF